MPFVTALLAGFSRLLGPLLVHFLISLGVGAVTYAGIGALITAAENQVKTILAGQGATIVQILSSLKVDTALSILFGAVAVRLTLMGMTAAGNLTRFRLGSGT